MNSKVAGRVSLLKQFILVNPVKPVRRALSYFPDIFEMRLHSVR